MIVRSNTGYKKFKSVADYDHQVGIAVPMRSPAPNGMPLPEEGAELDLIEDTICESLEAQADSLFVAVITTGGMREFVYYTRAPETVKQQFEQLRSSITSHEIQLMIQPDPDWGLYGQLA